MCPLSKFSSHQIEDERKSSNFNIRRALYDKKVHPVVYKSRLSFSLYCTCRFDGVIEAAPTFSGGDSEGAEAVRREL